MPWYFQHVAENGTTPYHATWPEDPTEAMDKFQHSVALRCLKAAIPALGAHARREAALPGAHAVFAADVGRSAASDTAAGWRMYDAVLAKWPSAAGGFEKADILAFDPAAPLFAL